MLCVGSSLEVYPVASLPQVTHERRAAGARHQGPLPTTRGRGEAHRRRRRRARGRPGRALALSTSAQRPSRCRFSANSICRHGLLQRRRAVSRQLIAQSCVRGRRRSASRCTASDPPAGAGLLRCHPRGEQRLDRHAAPVAPPRASPPGVQVGPGAEHQLLGRQEPPRGPPMRAAKRSSGSLHGAPRTPSFLVPGAREPPRTFHRRPRHRCRSRSARPAHCSRDNPVAVRIGARHTVGVGAPG